MFGYTLTSLPLLGAGLALSAVVPIVLATDTLSIAVIEIVDNAIIVIVPGAMEAGAGAAFLFGSAVLVAEAFSSDGESTQPPGHERSKPGDGQHGDAIVQQAAAGKRRHT